MYKYDTGDKPDPLTYSTWLVTLPDVPAMVQALSGALFFLSSEWKYNEVGDASIHETSQWWKEAMLNMKQLDMVGMIAPLMRDDVPDGWLLCDGTRHWGPNYPKLYAITPQSLLATYNRFYVPDLRGRFIYGASNITEQGEEGGAETHILTVDEMPIHSHTQAPHTHSYTQTVSSLSAGGEIPATANITTQVPSNTTPATPTISETGGGLEHNNLPPYYKIRYMIRYE